MDTFNIELVAGREFSREFSSDRENAFIVNEAVVRALGFPSPEDALGQEIRIGIGTKGAIIGVTKDYHISSFHEEIEPFITLYMPDLFVHMAVKIQSQNGKNLFLTIPLLFLFWMKILTVSIREMSRLLG